MLAFGQYFGNNLLHWGGDVPGGKWWKQQPLDLFGQLVVPKCLLDLVQKASKSIVTPAMTAPLVPL